MRPEILGLLLLFGFLILNYILAVARERLQNNQDILNKNMDTACPPHKWEYEKLTLPQNLNDNSDIKILRCKICKKFPGYFFDAE